MKRKTKTGLKLLSTLVDRLKPASEGAAAGGNANGAEGGNRAHSLDKVNNMSNNNPNNMLSNGK